MQQVKILLVQIASNGDCLFVTTIARQIKEIDYPGCHLTWLIGSKYARVILNNPYIDDVIQIPLNEVGDIQNQRDKINEYVENAGGYYQFNKIFITDYVALNKKNWFGTTRSSLFRSYPHPLKIDPQPLIYLTDEEKNNVSDFCKKHAVTDNTFNILFECAPQSGQSLMTFQRAKQLAEQLADQNKNIKFILTSNQSFVSANPNIIDGSVISWRENAELANYCHLLVGCSSGISWLCTSNWTKPIPFIQAINPNYQLGLASMKIDFKFWGVKGRKLIELNNPTDDVLRKCIVATSINNFETAQKKYDSKNYGGFLNYKFIKESRISILEKLWFYFHYFFFGPFFMIIYRTIKPGWFTPMRWIKNNY
jgi:hypothetical protein